MASITIQQLFNWKSRLNRFFNLFGSIPAIFQPEIKNHFLVIRAFVLFDSSELAFFLAINSGEKMLALTFIHLKYFYLSWWQDRKYFIYSLFPRCHPHTDCLHKLLNDPPDWHKDTNHESKAGSLTCPASAVLDTDRISRKNISFSVFSWADRECLAWPRTREVTSCASLSLLSLLNEE